VGIFSPTLIPLFGGAAVTDAAGDIYICNNGFSTQITSQTPNSVVKITSNGQLVWKQEFQGSYTAYPTVMSLAVHPTNGIYVTGTLTIFESGVTRSSLYAANVSASGALVWQAAHRVSSNAWVISSRVVSGSLEVYGQTTSRVFSSTGVISDYRTGQAPDLRAQDTVVAGYYYDGASTTYPMVSVRGFWGVRYGTGSGLFPISFSGVKQAASGNIYCVGVYAGYDGEGDPTGARLYLVKFSSSGTLIWQRYFNGDVGLSGSSASVTVDAEENIYVVGSAQGDFLTSFDSSGTLRWANRFTYGSGSGITLLNITISGSALLVTGYMSGQGKPFYARVPTSGAATGATVAGAYTVVYAAATINVFTPTGGALGIPSSSGSATTITLIASAITNSESPATLDIARL
jgi:hypothetical protein